MKAETWRIDAINVVIPNDEKTIDNKVFDYLVMNLMFNDENIETVSATVNDEVLAVSGYDNSVVEVSSIIFNEIKA